MKSYLLLRDNQEFGPFTLEEIKEKHLQPFDLVWEKSSSTQWLYPTELEELKTFVSKPEPKLIKQKARPVDNIEQAPARSVINKVPVQEKLSGAELYNYPVMEVSYARYPEQQNTAPTYFKSQKFSFGKTLTRESPVWLFALLGALIFGAFVVKQMVEVMDSQMVSDVQYYNSVAEDQVAQQPANSDYQNALHREVIPVKKVSKQSKKLTVNELKKLVKLTGSEYSVGLLGGIEDLSLTVANNSCHPLERVVIEVKYYKANGKTISTEEHNLFNVAPGTEKILEVPQNNRGVKVEYRIVGVESKTFKTALRQA